MIPPLRIAFEASREKLLADQWASDRVSPWLRAVLVIMCSLYVEQGAKRLLIEKLLGTEREIAERSSVHAYGLAADVSIIGVADRRGSTLSSFLNGREFPKPRWIEQRMNLLFPFGDGRKETATYVVSEAHIHVEVPARGFHAGLAPLSSWNSFGVNGNLEEPRRIAV